MYRQGDLLFVQAEIPQDAEQQDDGVIARGEVTGHMHRISDGAKAVLMVAAAQAYVRAMRDAEIVHDEHNAITLPAGDWQVVRQSEYTPSGWRQVED